MSSNAVLSTISIIAFLSPVIIILYYKFYYHRSMAALMTYYLIVAFYNIISLHIFPIPSSFISNFGIAANYLDAPLMILSLLFFCPNKQKQKKVYIITTLFLAYELVITCIYGFSSRSVTYILGPGIALVFVYVSFLFSRQAKFTIVHGKNMGKTIMLASIVFVYFCYFIIYFFYYVLNTNFVSDTYTVYFISSTVSCTLMSLGLVKTNKRLKELDDLRVTRKELKLFFNNN